ncbi:MULTISPECIES: GNAT family protein [unclassified Roseitalea]|uniref:GNAT family N-acetyltransferase n=1 Tax=unclassified Roseitalea TaxID=2639107 RepID=UPI00273DF8D4|nr:MULTISPECIES: GNAT family protein [unclassified Roseitalea]
MIDDLSQWTPRPTPTNAEMTGRTVRIVPFERAAHEDALWRAFGGPATNDLLYHFGWPHMACAADLGARLADLRANAGFVTCVFVHPATGRVMGMASYMRIDETNGVCEVGCVAHGAAMARSPASTEAHYLMARRIFDELDYRRYEWKLNNANAPSHRAARRFGFTFEGVFRQLEVKPYGNRDTAWYSMLDRQWPVARAAFERWLEPGNFDSAGRQRRTLESIRRDIHAGQA